MVTSQPFEVDNSMKELYVRTELKPFSFITLFIHRRK